MPRWHEQREGAVRKARCPIDHSRSAAIRTDVQAPVGSERGIKLIGCSADRVGNPLRLRPTVLHAPAPPDVVAWLLRSGRVGKFCEEIELLPVRRKHHVSRFRARMVGKKQQFPGAAPFPVKKAYR